MRTKTRSLRKSSVRLLSLILGLFFLATTVQAYTVVLRNGRIIEIPSDFVMHGKMITYEVSPGIQVSLQFAAINIPATETANREPAGSFLKRVQNKMITVPPPPTLNKTTNNTISNRDLEPFARARRDSEIAYERRRRELGLPSAAETRQRAAVDLEAARRRSEEDLSSRASNEAYWRERATNLRAEMAATDAEINSIRQSLVSLSNNNAPSITAVGVLPFGSSIFNPLLQQTVVGPGVFATNQNFNGWPIRGSRRGSWFHRQYGGYSGALIPFGGVPAFTPFGYQSYDSTYESTMLRTRLNELIGVRAGLDARWRALEEEARRAGAYPGWLRP